MNYSSSIHNINADKNLNKLEKSLYIFLNLINNYVGTSPGSRNGLLVKDYKMDIDEKEWGKLAVELSTAKKLGDLFWMKLPWQDIQEELGEINIFDTGCGLGQYFHKIDDYSKGRTNKYTGVDIRGRDNWQEIMEENDQVQLLEKDCSDMTGIIPEDTNMFMTNAAIEHFEKDLLYFEQIHDFISKNSRNTIQVHLIPSAACLWMYRFHGVRQYNARTISKIADIFKDYSYSTLYKLGGKESTNAFLEYARKPARKGIDFRVDHADEYDRITLEAIKADMQRPQSYPTFYALVIHSNFDNKFLHGLGK
jgi:hypothetical protein